MAGKAKLAVERREEKPERERPETTLRWLARTQNLDGSWEGDPEMTAAALLALVRAGHTTRRGHYRKAAQRAFDYLSAARPGGTAAFLRAVALAELAAATGLEAHREAAEAALTELPRPGGALERVALARAGAPGQEPAGVPERIESLDDLRIAAVGRARREIRDSLFGGRKRDLVRAWAACLAEG